MSQQQYDDAAFARALQEEYEREYRRRGMQRHLGETATASVAPPQPSAPPADTTTTSFDQGWEIPTLPFDNSHQHDHAFPHPEFEIPAEAHHFEATFNDHNNMNTNSIEVTADEAFARKMMEEEELQMKRQMEAEREKRERREKQRRSQRAAATTSATRTSAISARTTIPRGSTTPSGTPRATSSSQQQSRRTAAAAATAPRRSHSHSSHSSTNRSEKNLSRSSSQRLLERSSHSSHRNVAGRPSTPVPPKKKKAAPAPTTVQVHQQQRKETTRTLSEKAAVTTASSRSRRMEHRDSAQTASTIGSSDNFAVFNNGNGGVSSLTDEEIARRLEQEEQDEELARQWLAEEQMRRNDLTVAREVHQLSNTDANQSNARKCGVCCALRKCLSCLLTLILVVVAIVLFLYFFEGTDSVKDFIPDPDRFREEDPFNNANPDDANLWRTDGDGLRLDVVNALDSDWYEYFYRAIDEWDSGTPDALTLKTETAEPESLCRVKNGKLKVCNGNYGDTNWRGINKVLLENGWIYASAARMNEFYSNGKDHNQRQYTMCHEIGHGFGLPHTDEDFFNKDLLNCMDYTNNPSVNKQPAEPNFKFLAQLYGTVDGSPVPQDDAEEGSTVTTKENVPESQRSNKGGSKRKARRTLLRSRRNRGKSTNNELPPRIVEALDEIDMLVDSGVIGTEEDGWRKLHETDHGQAHEVDLGDGYTVQLHMLKVLPE